MPIKRETFHRYDFPFSILFNDSLQCSARFNPIFDIFLEGNSSVSRRGFTSFWDSESQIHEPPFAEKIANKIPILDGSFGLDVDCV